MESVEKQVKDAYSESNDSQADRDLDFLASEPVSVKEVAKIYGKATPNGYNRFSPANLLHLEDYFKGEPKVIPAREASVCIYVVGNIKSSATASDSDMGRTLKNDEFHEFTPQEFLDHMDSKRERKKNREYGRDGYQVVSNKLRKMMKNTDKNVYRFWWD